MRNVTRKFKITLKYNDWVKKWYVGVHNTASSRKLNWRSPLEVSDGFTQDISKFHFHIWEPIWYFNKSKVPQNPWQSGRWMGFAYSTGEKMLLYQDRWGRSSDISFGQSYAHVRRTLVMTGNMLMMMQNMHHS